MILKGLYVVLLGLFLSLFVGIGISTFYKEPIYQVSTPCMNPIEKTPANATASAKQDEACQRYQLSQQKKTDFHNQIVSTIALIAAVIYVVMSFVVFKNQPIFSYGFLFGSMFTLLYSLLRGLNSNHEMFTFIIVVISVVLVMTIGYLRFVKTEMK